MSPKKFSNLSDKEKEQIYKRYNDTSTLEMYLYNFDEKGNYVNRQYFPEGISLVNEPVKESKPSHNEVKEEVKEDKPKKRTKKK